MLHPVVPPRTRSRFAGETGPLAVTTIGRPSVNIDGNSGRIRKLAHAQPVIATCRSDLGLPLRPRQTRSRRRLRNPFVSYQPNNHPPRPPRQISQHRPVPGGDPRGLLAPLHEPVPDLPDLPRDMPGTVEHPVGEVEMLEHREHPLRGVWWQPAPPAMTSACRPSETFSPKLTRSPTWPIVAPARRQNAENLEQDVRENVQSLAEAVRAEIGDDLEFGTG